MFSSEPVQATAQALHGLVSNAEWTGVLLSTLLEETGIDPKAKWLLAEGADSLALHRSVPVKKALDDAMIALYQNGERIMPGNGYPMRLLLPGYQGNMNVKYRAPDQAHRSAGHELLRGQDLLADPAGRQDVAVPLHCRRSNRSSPIPRSATALKGPGYYEISGVAYSGNGRIAKVMVSADGGKSWAQAALQEPVLPKAFTRFRMPWRWDGQPVDPAEPRLGRGRQRAADCGPSSSPRAASPSRPVTNPLAFPNQHYNSITSWGIDSKGEIKHVYA